MNVQTLYFRAVDDQVRYLHQELAQSSDIQRSQGTTPADLLALDPLDHQVARQVHVQRRQGNHRLLFRTPLNAPFAQHDQWTKDRIVFNHHP